MDMVIRNTTIAGESRHSDIGIDAGRIVAVAERIEEAGTQEIHADGNLVSPGFVDVHMHNDKALLVDRYDWSMREYKATRRLTSIHAVNQMKPHYTVEDVRNRATRVAEMCIVNGITTLRTHAEVDPAAGLTAVKGVLEAKEACRDWIDMQVVANPFCGYHYESGFDSVDGAEKMFREAIELGVDAVGTTTEAEPDWRGNIDRVFRLAKEYGKFADFHADQHLNPPPLHIPYIAEKTMADGMQGRVLIAHYFALVHVSPEERCRAIQALEEAQISLCFTPFSDIQERMIEPLEGGVNAVYINDNMRDCFTPFGNADMILLALFVARLGPWTTNEELDRIFDMATVGAPRAIGLAEEHGIAVGKTADLVVLEARSRHEAIVDQVRRLWVLKRGKVVARDGQLLVKH